MPQETKSFPSNPDAMELAPGFARENLEGWIPPMAADGEIRDALEKAFDYRGDLTLTLKDGARIEGYIFDRQADSKTLNECYVRLFPKDRDEKRKVSYAQIARIEFTGRDTAAGKTWEAWVKKYQERKEKGETNIQLEPEKLD